MLAYNLMSLFRHFALNDKRKSTFGTLKDYCYALGAWKEYYANKTVLKKALYDKK
jgi:hypothetical protein